MNDRTLLELAARAAGISFHTRTGPSPARRYR